MPVELLGKQN